MRKRGVSGAYRELQQALAATGRSVSATQLERWAYWRSGGLIDRPRRHGAGRGTRSKFPDLARARDQAAAVADTLRPRMRLDTAALLLHRKGHPILDEDVKAAFIAELEAAQRRFLRNARVEETSDPLDQALAAGWSAYRLFSRGDRAQRRRRAKAELPDARAWTLVGRMLLGQEVTRADLQTALDELPVPSAVLGEDALSRIEVLANHASFPALIEGVASLSAEGVAQMNRAAARLAPMVGLPPRPDGEDEVSINFGIAIGLMLGLSHGEHILPIDLPDNIEELVAVELRA